MLKAVIRDKEILVVNVDGSFYARASRDKKSVRIKLKQEVVDRIKGGMTMEDIPHSMVEAIEEAQVGYSKV